MIVCMEGRWGKRTPTEVPGFGLIDDPVVAYACGMVFDCPNLEAAEAKLRKVLDLTKYIIGHGQNHVFVSENSGADWPERLAMLVDPDDTNVWWSFPALKDWRWSGRDEEV